MSAPENRARAAKAAKALFQGQKAGKLPKSTQVCTI